LADEATFAVGPVVKRKLKRSKMLEFFSRIDPCLVGMEACGSAHYWERELTAMGHDVLLMPPAYTKPYVKRGKNDAVDAEAICERCRDPGCARAGQERGEPSDAEFRQNFHLSRLFRFGVRSLDVTCRAAERPASMVRTYRD
jgi:transposase